MIEVLIAFRIAAAAVGAVGDSDRQGDEGDGYHWHVQVAAAGTAQLTGGNNAIPAGAATLYRIAVTLSWRDGGVRRAVRLDSARLGPLG